MNRTCKKCGEEKSLTEFRFRDKRHTIRRWICHECYRVESRKYYADDKENRCTQRKKHRKENPEIQKVYSKRHREKVGRFVCALRSSRNMSQRHGYTACTATSDEIKKAFTGKCEVCGVPEIECRRRLHLDHDHETGEFRGWLCGNCNSAAGHLKDSVALTYNLLEYLARTERKEHGPQETSENLLSSRRTR